MARVERPWTSLIYMLGVRFTSAGAGWIGLDPTSGLFAGEGHIPLACTPQPSNAAIEGLVDEAEVEFSHDMKVTRVLESPRDQTLYRRNNGWKCWP
jgi:transglutaminase-like putative cysteine protease